MLQSPIYHSSFSNFLPCKSSQPPSLQSSSRALLILAPLKLLLKLKRPLKLELHFHPRRNVRFHHENDIQPNISFPLSLKTRHKFSLQL